MDITYCIYYGCPLYKNCDRHISKAPKTEKYVSVCDFAPVCENYLTHLLHKIENEGDRK